jgi:hypothetical protein
MSTCAPLRVSQSLTDRLTDRESTREIGGGEERDEKGGRGGGGLRRHSRHTRGHRQDHMTNTQRERARAPERERETYEGTAGTHADEDVRGVEVE